MTTSIAMAVIGVGAVAFMVRFLVALSREPHTKCHVVHVARWQESPVLAPPAPSVSRAFLYADPTRAQSVARSGVEAAGRRLIYISERRVS